MSNEFYDLGKRMYERLKPAVPIATQRPWVGLTDAEYQAILRQHEGAGLLAFYNLVETQLKRKNV
jgi:hypothetical protein